jgi:predicted nucleic acid-binding protein
MTLDDIPGGSLCVIDTNVLLYAEHGASGQAQRLLRRCALGELTGVLPEPVWLEVTHKLMLAEAMMIGLVAGGNPAARLAEKPDAVRALSLYRAKVKALVDMGLGFEACTLPDLTDAAFGLQQKYGLLTNDSLVLAVAIRREADAIVSTDKGFQSIKEIPVYRPTDFRI